MQNLELLDALHEHGNYSYFWTSKNRESFWYACWDPEQRAKALQRACAINGTANVYMNVHPCTQIPTTTSLGQARPSAFLRGRIPHVMLANCLYAEFDFKDFQNNDGKTAKHIRSLPVLPSVIVHSGGGYHTYWLLKEPYLATDELRDYQRRWVEMVGGDGGAKDITRVLRVPGTKNTKYPGHPTVTIKIPKMSDPAVRYDLGNLLDLLPAKEPLTLTSLPAMNASGEESVYVDAAMRDITTRLLAAAPGNRNNELNYAAMVVGNLVAAPWTGLDKQWATDQLVQAAMAIGLHEDPGCGYSGINATIQSGIAAGMRHPRRQPNGYTNNARDILSHILNDRAQLATTGTHSQILDSQDAASA